jgi:hypothetical protein
VEQAVRSEADRGLTQEELWPPHPASLRRAHEPELLGQTVVVIGGSAGIGLELGAASIAAFDATDFERLDRAPRGLQALALIRAMGAA